jgi:UDP-glucose 4-epimerase
VRLIIDNPVRTIETNVQGADVVLRAAAKKRKRVVIASSSEVYGKSAKAPFAEDDDLVMGPTNRARWSYACSKALDEFLGLAYHAQNNVPVSIVRFFNTVGPRQTGRYGMVLPNFVRQAMFNEPITVYGDGSQRRCFGYVLDAVEALVRIVTTEATVGQILNIGNDQEISIYGLAQLVRGRLRSQSEIVRLPYDEVYGPGFEDMLRRVPSLQKLERLIAYRPTTPLETIVDAVAADIRTCLALDIDARRESGFAALVPQPA